MSKPQSPNDEVRMTVVMTFAQRNRLRVIALRAGESLEKMGARWLLERADVEESKAATDKSDVKKRK